MICESSLSCHLNLKRHPKKVSRYKKEGSWTDGGKARIDSPGFFYFERAISIFFIDAIVHN